MLHRGVHEPPGLPDVEHVHADPHFRETLDEALGDRTFDLVVATYGRMRVIAEYFERRTGHLVGVGGVPVYRGFIDPAGSKPWGTRLNAPEDSPLADAPHSPPFARMMVEAERAVMARGAGGAYRASYVRYPPIYGPRNVVPYEWAVVKRVLDGRTRMIVPDDGLWVISRCAAENAAAAIVSIVDDPETADGEIYNVADQEQLTVRQWVERVADLAGGALELVGIPSALAGSALHELLIAGARPHMLVDTSKIRRQLGYVDAVTVDQGLAATVAWLRDNPPTKQAYPVYSGVFDYELEDRLMSAYALAVEQVRAAAPDPVPAPEHPMPHPKSPGQTTDERGR